MKEISSRSGSWPLTDTQAIAHLKLDAAPPDLVYVQETRDEACAVVEKDTGWILKPADIYLYLKDWPADNIINMEMAPLVSAVIKYDNGETGYDQTFAASNYETRKTLFYPKIVINSNADLPDLNDEIEWPIRITLTMGFEDQSDVYPGLKRLCRVKLAELYENRGNPIRERDSLYEKLKNPWMIWTM